MKVLSTSRLRTLAFAPVVVVACSLVTAPAEPDPPLLCGDGVVEAAEQCDDGNTVDTDACRTACVAAECGDGVVHKGKEGCDDGNASDTDECLTTCVSATCGDGIVQAEVEECDDGNASDTDECLTTCVSATCGDGIVQ
ncbi:MAG: DUF4215 domain-containing protein, partial [Myxococcales bacterium]|nr:DUF4215 domain-containing protein [Myxococcales bacterium]